MANTKKPVKTEEQRESIPFTMMNYILFAAGLLIITAGWFMLRAGHISISPIMLILGYCVIIPVAIIIAPGQKKDKAE